jgi:hypothetical protein
MTVALTLAYIVFFLAKRSEGITRVLGRALGLWLIGIAIVVFVLGACMQLYGTCPLDNAVIRALSGEPEVQQIGPRTTTGAARSY